MIAGLTTIMTKTKSRDAVGASDERNVNVVLQTSPAKNFLQVFNFSIRAILKAHINEPKVIHANVGILLLNLSRPYFVSLRNNLEAVICTTAFQNYDSV